MILASAGLCSHTPSLNKVKKQGARGDPSPMHRSHPIYSMYDLRDGMGLTVGSGIFPCLFAI